MNTGEHGSDASGGSQRGMIAIDGLLDRLFRHKAGQMVSTLTRIFGPENLELAEDVVQEALLKAAEQWPLQGVPASPVAWLVQVAKNRAIDLLRRDALFRERSEEIQRALLAEQFEAESAAGDPARGAGVDDVLAMMFLCCHPEIPSEGRVALTLKTVSGFGVGEIARAFLAQEAAIAQRLVRAKRRIRERRIPFERLPVSDLRTRLDSVLQVLYLTFNEGYAAHQGEELVRADMCHEAIRLCELLARHPATEASRVHALLALMLLQAARLPARIDAAGELLLLSEQDRSFWDRTMIARGLSHLERSAGGDAISEYHLEAGIAAFHAVAETYAATAWDSILDLYDQLLALSPSPVVALNRSVALSRCRGAAAGIEAVQAIQAYPGFAGYHLFWSTLASLYMDLRQSETAASCYRAALACPCSEPERRFLQQRLARALG